MSTTASQDEQSGAFITYLLTAFLGVIGAVIGWAIFKDKGPFAKDQTTEALNWSITILIVFIALQVLSIVLSSISGMLAMLIGLLVLVAWLGHLVMCIMAALKAKTGVAYRFPFALRLVK